MPDTPIQDLPLDRTVAWVFPGQGAQHVGMGADLADQSATARAVFSSADTALGISLSQLCFEGPEDELTRTINTQPAIVTHSIAALATADGESRAAQRLAAVRDLGAAAGSARLVGGQVEDLTFDASQADAARVESVHARKSAALIAAAVVGGARLAGADEAILARLRRCGEAVGVAFQIADDLLDEGEDEGCSLVRLVGPDAARARAEELLAAALGELEDLGERAEPLRALVRYAVRRTG